MNDLKCLFIVVILILPGTQLELKAQEDSTEISYYKLGSDAFRSYQFSEAASYFKKSIQEDSSSVNSWCFLGMSQAKLGELGNAQKSLESAIRLDSTSQLAWRQYGVLMKQKEHFSRAENAFLQLTLLDSTNSYYFKKLGSVLKKQGEVVKSLRSFSKALELNDQDIESMMELAVLFNALQQYGDVDYWLSKADSLDSSNPRVLLLKTKNAYRTKNYSGVVDAAERWLEVREDTVSYVIKLLGVAQYHEGNYEMAIQLLEKVLLMEEPSESVHYYLGLSYEALGNSDKSETHFKLAIESGTSSNVSIYFTNLARNYEIQGKYEESIRAYKAAYQQSKNKLLLYHLARNYDAYYKNKETALLYYEKYLAANDTEHVEFNNYTEHRIEELNEVLHFEIDTLR